MWGWGLISKTLAVHHVLNYSFPRFGPNDRVRKVHLSTVDKTRLVVLSGPSMIYFLRACGELAVQRAFRGLRMVLKNRSVDPCDIAFTKALGGNNNSIPSGRPLDRTQNDPPRWSINGRGFQIPAVSGDSH
jgi:hypothetical protein